MHNLLLKENGKVRIKNFNEKAFNLKSKARIYKKIWLILC